MRKLKIWKITIIAGCLLALTGCAGEALAEIPDVETTQVEELDQAATAAEDEALGSDSEPNYAVVFPDDKVNEITISIDPESWQAMLEDMTQLYGEQGTGADRMGEGRVRPGVGDELPAQRDDQPSQDVPGGMQPPDGMQAGGQRGMNGRMENDEQNPIWVEATVEFQGETWEHVGIRFKGNSSLRSTWSSGSLKLPLKLDFDQFEDDYPETQNQRFYGFKQLSLSSNWSDSSYLREKVTYDVFNEAGVAASETAFYAVSLDYGDGPVYLGLYTMVEVVDDTLIEIKFSDDDGNVYKPSGSGATFAAGSFNEASFDKETNQDEDDYSDILALYDALHSDLRFSDPSSWRAGLEEVFNADGFLNWLAVNTVVQNWDTYGRMNHNYYLYNDPSSGQLTWIPWDNNMALSSTLGMGQVLPLDQETVGDDWPLISFLMADEVYHQTYVECVENVIDGAFDPQTMAETYQRYHDMIEPYVSAEDSGTGATNMRGSVSTFETSVEELIAHVNSRYAEAQDYLASQQ